VKAKPSAWLTPREAAALIGWKDENAALRLTRTIRRAEKTNKDGLRILHVIPTPQRTRLMVTMEGIKALLPNLFAESDEYLPGVLVDKFDKVEERATEIAGRSAANGASIRALKLRVTALEAAIAKLTATKLRVVK